jgi:hypothetical protein
MISIKCANRRGQHGHFSISQQCPKQRGAKVGISQHLNNAHIKGVCYKNTFLRPYYHLSPMCHHLPLSRRGPHPHSLLSHLACPHYSLPFIRPHPPSSLNAHPLCVRHLLRALHAHLRSLCLSRFKCTLRALRLPLRFNMCYPLVHSTDLLALRL